MLSTDAKSVLEFDGREQAESAFSKLVTAAKREILFFGNNLDAVLLNNTDIIQSLSDLALRNQRISLRFLVESTLQNRQQKHRLLLLNQKLSNIHIHNTDPQTPSEQDMFLLSDDDGFIYFKWHKTYHGLASLNDRVRVKQLKLRFEQMWLNSHPDNNIQRLYL
jgi:hypothetical protein